MTAPLDERQFTGEYYSDEIDAVLAIVRDGNGLVLRRETDGMDAPIDNAESVRARNMTVRFERGDDGRVRALVVDAGRVRDIRFVRRAASGTR